MSRYEAILERYGHGFPRVSGDEPARRRIERGHDTFSPRERG